MPQAKTLSKPSPAKKHRSQKRKNSNRLEFARLESRQLLAGVFLFAATGELTIYGDAEDNIARIDEVDSTSLRTTLVGLGTTDFDRSDVHTVFFIGFGGDDNFVNNTSIRSMMYGHAGNDILQGGRGENTIVGGAGNDFIDLGIASDDVAVFSSDFANYTLDPVLSGQRVIVTGPDGTDIVLATERFRFDDTEVDSDGNSPFGSVITVRASGDMGTEQFDLQIDGQTVSTFDVETSFDLFVFQFGAVATADQVRIVFSGDEYDEEHGIDANLNVDWIDIDGKRFETDSPMVFSTGTWTPDDGIHLDTDEVKRFIRMGIFSTHRDPLLPSLLPEMWGPSNSNCRLPDRTPVSIR